MAVISTNKAFSTNVESRQIGESGKRRTTALLISEKLLDGVLTAQ
jgi:hypothetical protein